MATSSRTNLLSPEEEKIASLTPIAEAGNIPATIQLARIYFAHFQSLVVSSRNLDISTHPFQLAMRIPEAARKTSHWFEKVMKSAHASIEDKIAVSKSLVYLYIIMSQLNEAKLILEFQIKHSVRLAHFNLGIYFVKSNQILEAIKELKQENDSSALHLVSILYKKLETEARVAAKKSVHASHYAKQATHYKNQSDLMQGELKKPSFRPDDVSFDFLFDIEDIENLAEPPEIKAAIKEKYKEDDLSEIKAAAAKGDPFALLKLAGRLMLSNNVNERYQGLTLYQYAAGRGSEPARVFLENFHGSFIKQQTRKEEKQQNKKDKKKKRAESIKMAVAEEKQKKEEERNRAMRTPMAPAKLPPPREVSINRDALRAEIKSSLAKLTVQELKNLQKTADAVYLHGLSEGITFFEKQIRMLEEEEKEFVLLHQNPKQTNQQLYEKSSSIIAAASQLNDAILSTIHRMHAQIRAHKAREEEATTEEATPTPLERTVEKETRRIIQGKGNNVYYPINNLTSRCYARFHYATYWDAYLKITENPATADVLTKKARDALEIGRVFPTSQVKLSGIVSVGDDERHTFPDGYKLWICENERVPMALRVATEEEKEAGMDQVFTPRAQKGATGH